MSSDRLEKLRQIRSDLERGIADEWRLIQACLPGWNIAEARGDGTGPHRLWVIDPQGEGQWVDDPLVSERGAIWLVNQALPGWSIDIHIDNDENLRCGTTKAAVVWSRRVAGSPMRWIGTTAALAICRAVLEALIFQLERQEAA